MKTGREGADWTRYEWPAKKMIVIVPKADLRRHVAMASDCWCEPVVAKQPAKWSILLHNSMDGRELIKRHGLQ